jgi:hypothetical protein
MTAQPATQLRTKAATTRRRTLRSAISHIEDCVPGFGRLFGRNVPRSMAER